MYQPEPEYRSVDVFVPLPVWIFTFAPPARLNVPNFLYVCPAASLMYEPLKDLVDEQ